MGTLKKAWESGHNRLGRGKVGRRAYPLRKIVDSDGEYEILECGHKGASHIVVGTDLFSTYQPANSRRCRECWQEKNKEKAITDELKSEN